MTRLGDHHRRHALLGIAAALVCASACGGALPASDSARGGAGGGGGSTSTGGSTNSGPGGGIWRGAGTTGTSNAGSTGTGAGGQGGCDTSATATCACDSQAAECQPVLANVCLGSTCPPSLDDAMLVANWSFLDSAMAPGFGRTQAYYDECQGGTRRFTFNHTGNFFGFAFDGNGHLVAWAASDGSSCSRLMCGDDRTLPQSPCSSCAMFSDPQPEGTLLIPRGTSNGYLPSCEVNANGRWSEPHLAPAN